MTTTKKDVAKRIVAKKTNSPSATRTIKRLDSEQVQEVFVDGLSNVMAGPTVAKIAFFATIQRNETEETRKTAIRLVMSTEVMIDTVLKLRASILKNEKTLDGAFDAHKTKTLESLNKLKD